MSDVKQLENNENLAEELGLEEKPRASNVVAAYKKPPGNKGLTLEEVTEALKQAAGIRAIAAKALGVSRATVSYWVKQHPELRDVINEYNGRMVDKAALNVMKSINKGNLTASMFWLKTQGKSEGWSERQEITGPSGGPVVSATVDWSSIPVEERIAALQRLGAAPKDESG